MSEVAWWVCMPRCEEHSQPAYDSWIALCSKCGAEVIFDPWQVLVAARELGDVDIRPVCLPCSAPLTENYTPEERKADLLRSLAYFLEVHGELPV